MMPAQIVAEFNRLQVQAERSGLDIKNNVSCFIVSGHDRGERIYLDTIEELQGFIDGYGYGKGRYPNGTWMKSEPFVQSN